MIHNLNPEDIIKEAITVRDDGQEPKHSHECYDQALLYVARKEQSPSEDFPTALARVVRLDMDCDALIFAADRARAAAAFVKSAPPSPVALDAEQVRKSGSTPCYTRDDYHNEMVALSKALARPGETPAVAFGRLVSEGAFDDLYAAGEAADIAEVEAVSKSAPPDDRFFPILRDLAQLRKRDGETLEKCMDRLLTTDRTVMDAYAASQGL